MRTERFLPVTLCALLALAACGGKQKAGEPGGPAENYTVGKTSLTVPPDYAMRPGKEDDHAPQIIRASSGEARILNEAGAGAADPTIRQRLENPDAGAAPAEEEKPGFFARLFGGGKKEAPAPMKDEPAPPAEDEGAAAPVQPVEETTPPPASEGGSFGEILK